MLTKSTTSDDSDEQTIPATANDSSNTDNSDKAEIPERKTDAKAKNPPRAKSNKRKK